MPVAYPWWQKQRNVDSATLNVTSALSPYRHSLCTAIYRCGRFECAHDVGLRVESTTYPSRLSILAAFELFHSTPFFCPHYSGNKLVTHSQVLSLACPPLEISACMCWSGPYANIFVEWHSWIVLACTGAQIFH